MSRARNPDASSPLVVALFGLTFVTGVIDAVSFLGLGHVFTANMTGNVVFLGFAIAGTADVAVGRSLAALCAFASGSVVGGRLTNESHRTPAKQLLIAMYAEVVFLCLAAGAALIASDIDVYAPCALGGALDDDTVTTLQAKIVAGGANNQLAHPGVEKLLVERGILYAPDYVVNSAAPYAVIGAGELGYSEARLAASVQGTASALQAIFRRALELSGVPASEAVMVGDRMVQDVWGAKRLGMRAIWRRPLAGAPQEPVDVEPDASIDDLTELRAVLERWM